LLQIDNDPLNVTHNSLIGGSVISNKKDGFDANASMYSATPTFQDIMKQQLGYTASSFGIPEN
jgi:hypothetical protein